MATKTTTTAAKKAPARTVRTASAKPAAKAATKAKKVSTKKAAAPAAKRARNASVTPAAPTPELPAVTAPEGKKAAARAPRENSAQARVIAMMKAPEGASLKAIMKETGWQAHTVRGFVSGTAKKKLGLNITSSRVDGERTYSIAA